MMHRSLRLLSWLLAPCVPACGANSRDEPAAPAPNVLEVTATEEAGGGTQLPQGSPSGARSAPGDAGSSQPLRDSESGRAESDRAAPAPSQTDGDGTTPAALDDACGSVPSENACERCVCERCPRPLADCAETPGCPEIMACAAQTGCTTTDCFCGSASITACLNGQADGPCRDVFLSAPGGREPSLAQPSAGPAADAAQGVADCAQSDDNCSSVCFEN